MWQIVLGAWAVAGVLTAGVLTGVAQNAPAALEPEAQEQRKSQERSDTAPVESGETVAPQSRPTAPKGVAEDRDDLGIQFRMSNSGQIMFSTISQRSSAAAAGLREGDIVVSVAGRTFATEPALREFLIRLSPEDRIPVVVMREGRRQTALWALSQEQPLAEDGDANASRPAGREPRGERRSVREQRVARPDFGLAERVERMETEIGELRREIGDLRQRLNAIGGARPVEPDDSRQPGPDAQQGLIEPAAAEGRVADEPDDSKSGRIR
jgi:hypothetical protein